jgi:ABC-2 type transport system ATP-binding protein
MTGKDSTPKRAQHRKPSNRPPSVQDARTANARASAERAKAAKAKAPAGDAPGSGGASTGPTAPVEAPAPQRAKRAPSAPAPSVEAVGLAKSYGDVPALAPLSLLVEPGEAVVLIGHNGSGKTTFLRMAAGLLDPSEGIVDISGHPAGSMEARAACSYLPDNPTFYDDLSVWEHLEYVARLHGVVDWEQNAADLLGHLGLYERAADLPVTFSRGLRQKASLTLGLIRPFDVLLVDEPFVGLDASGKVALLELFEEVRARGTTLLVATHELELVKKVDRCVALRDGALLYDGPAEGIDVLELVS